MALKDNVAILGAFLIKNFGNGGYAAICGFPHITIPAYQNDGYPVGVSVIGRPWDDLLVFQIAAVLETFFKLDSRKVNTPLFTGSWLAMNAFRSLNIT